MENRIYDFSFSLTNIIGKKKGSAHSYNHCRHCIHDENHTASLEACRTSNFYAKNAAHQINQRST